MKPDNKNPGSVESAANAEAFNAANNRPEFGAPQPQLAVNNQAPIMQQNMSEAKPASNQTASQQEAAPGSFETQIAQLAAADSDTIEQDWIDKAREIETKAASDPYSEDEAHHALSRAYLKKRFNIDVE
jgi:hypothetical protein